MGFDITGIGSILDFGGKIIDKIFPDPNAAAAAKLELFKAQQAGEFKELDAQIEIAKAQIGVNAVEAANPSLFVSGWRPNIGWICGAALGWNFILRPIVVTVAVLYGHPVDLPSAEMGELLPVLGALLGIGAMRTVEKVKGVA